MTDRIRRSLIVPVYRNEENIADLIQAVQGLAGRLIPQLRLKQQPGNRAATVPKRPIDLHRSIKLPLRIVRRIVWPTAPYVCCWVSVFWAGKKLLS